MWGIVAVLLVVIAVMAWILFATPTPAHAPTVATSTTPTTTEPTKTPTGPAPLHESVVVTSPAAGATVGHTFDVSGTAPGPWYFEATFPIQVRDPGGNVIGRIPANAQGDWMVTGPVVFKATLHIDAGYSGPATLILMKDNPSGLPENEDSVEVSIVIQ